MNKKNTLNEQEQFWAKTYANDYIKKNSSFDLKKSIEAWNKMTLKIPNIKNILECGCNIGRNLNCLNRVYPQAKKSIIEISKPAYDHVLKTYNIKNAYNGSIISSNFFLNSFDLVFTMGVLIHISPKNLIANMKKMFDYSNKYILIGEYFNRQPTTIMYQGLSNKLFKCDFGKIFINNFNVKLLDYGFLWGHLYDNAGFDDITWWLFKKIED
jgi:pseudaminic acid biosynthesis-associated methylase